MNRFLILASISLVMAGSGCLRLDEASDTDTVSYQAVDYDRFELVTENGEIISSVGEDSAITVTLIRWASGVSDADARRHLDEIDVRVTKDTADRVLSVYIEVPEAWTRNYGCDAEIILPDSIYVDLATSNGQIAASGHQAGLVLTTSNGKIIIAETQGAAELSTSNGDVRVNRHQGDIQAQTSNGEMWAEVIMSRSRPDGDFGYSRFESTNGKITVAVPDSVGAQIFMETSNGSLQVEGLSVGDLNPDPDIFEGRMGDESGEIDLRSSNGDINLKKLR